MAITRLQNKRRKMMLIADDVVGGDRRGGGGSPVWLLLPPEILHCVVGLLDFAPDLLSFSSVCRDWRTAGLAFSHRLLSPLLFFSSGLQTFGKSSLNDVGGVPRFFSLSKNKGFKLQLPPDMESKWWCVGSSYGWLILVDKWFPLYSDVQLFNPFAAKKNAVVRLPPIRTLRKLHERRIVRKPEGFARHDCCSIGRAFLSCNPRLTTTDNKGGVGESSSWNKSCLVVVLRDKELFLCRPGDDRWKRISPGYPLDAIFFQGCLYALMANGVLRAYDVDDDSLVQSVYCFQAHQRLVPSVSFPFDHLFRGNSDKCLVQSSGELLMILRKIEFVSYPLRDFTNVTTVGFSLFKLNQQKGEWTEVHDIGQDHTIFIGNSQSMCLSSHDYPGWKTNCIYFIIDRRCLCQPSSIQEVSVFDLKQGTISLFDISDLRRHDVLFWLTPDINWR